MTKTNIKNLLSDIIKEVDYDIWEHTFGSMIEEPEENMKHIDNLVKIVRLHIP